MNPTIPTTQSAAHRPPFIGGRMHVEPDIVKPPSYWSCNVATFDNLSTSQSDAVLSGEFVPGDLVARTKLNALFAIHAFYAAYQLASFINVTDQTIQATNVASHNKDPARLNADTIRACQEHDRPPTHDNLDIIFKDTRRPEGITRALQ